MEQKPKKQKLYIDNKKLTAELADYVEQYKSNKVLGLGLPRASEYIGECIMKISYHLASKHNFSRYTYKEEMIGDGIENCLKYMHNFNIEKTQNGFSYMTQIIFCAFLRRMEKEKKQEYVKYKLFENSGMENVHHNSNERMNELLENDGYSISSRDILRIDDSKSKVKKKKVSSNINTLERFI